MNRTQREIWVSGSKADAREILKQKPFAALGAAALLLIPVALLSEALRLACLDENMRLLPGLTTADVLAALGAYALAQLLIVLPLYFGLTQYCATLRASAQPQISVVLVCLCSLRMYGRGLWMALIQLLYAALWMLPCGAICAAGYALYRYALPNNLGYLLFLEIVILTTLWYLARLLPYQCGYAVCAEQKGMSCWRAVRTAAKKCRGHGGDLYSLLLSFFVWFLLAAIIGGLLMIFVLPYFLLSLYFLFDRIRGVKIIAAKKEE